MFVVPLYAFLTTTVPKTETARTVAANNIVNSGAMVVGSLLAFALSSVGRRPGRAAAVGRGDVPGVRLARLEAPPRLRLIAVSAMKDRDEEEAGREGRREQLEVVCDGCVRRRKLSGLIDSAAHVRSDADAAAMAGRANCMANP